jgi:hypothetical protein
MHDEFAQLLVEGLPTEEDLLALHIDYNNNDLEIKSNDNETVLLYKIYRRKLQSFLATSLEYHPTRVLKFLPKSYLHENALVFSKLSRHRDVLKIYCLQLKNQLLAELYCEKFYHAMTGRSGSTTGEKGGDKGGDAGSASVLPTFTVSNLQDPGEIYLLLFEVSRPGSHLFLPYFSTFVLFLSFCF